MMRITTLALVLALGAAAAHAQAPATPAAPALPAVPAAKCEPKPVYPGVKAIQDENRREAFTRELKNYQDCVKAYVAERKAFIEASNAAIRTTVEEHNAIMTKIREDQEKVKKDLGQ